MGKKSSVYLIIFLGLIIVGYFFTAKIVGENTEKNPANYKSSQPEVGQSGADFTVGGKPPVKEPKILETPKMPEKKIPDVVFDIPYVNEAPLGVFAGPWKNACEEASITMVEGYYLGKKTIENKEAE
mgnify:FL=1